MEQYAAIPSDWTKNSSFVGQEPQLVHQLAAPAKHVLDELSLIDINFKDVFSTSLPTANVRNVLGLIFPGPSFGYRR